MPSKRAHREECVSIKSGIDETNLWWKKISAMVVLGEGREKRITGKGHEEHSGVTVMFFILKRAWGTQMFVKAQAMYT